MRLVQMSTVHMVFLRLVLAGLTAQAAHGAEQLMPQPDALASFTTAVRARQPSDSFAAVYQAGSAPLIWLGARHETRTDSLAFSLINDAYRQFTITTVLVEGCPESWGPNSERLINYALAGAEKEKDGFQPHGTDVPTVLGGIAEGATLLCAEPSDVHLKEDLLSQNISAEDLLGFYTLRSIPQWIRERKIVDAADPALGDLLASELVNNRQRLGLDTGVLAAPENWHDWYRKTNGRPLGADFIIEEVGPLADGPHGTNKVAVAISRARAVFLHRRVIDYLNAGETVMVVFGASHLMIHRPALDAVLGQPCYVGANLRDAAKQC